MYAQQLESLLGREYQKMGHTYREPTDLRQRFEKLRGSRLIPQNSSDALRHLTPIEIAAGIISLVAAKPGYAGLSTVVLLSLKPVGGASASFMGSATFGEALAHALENEKALESLLEVRISDDEIYTNSNGRACITYLSDGKPQVAYYVRGEACSLLQEGSNTTYDPRDTISPVMSEVIFYKRFFFPIVRAVKETASLPPPAYILADVATADEKKAAEDEKKKSLGITGASRFLQVGVENQVTWPKEDTLVKFDGCKLILKPKTKEHTTSVHIDLYANRLSDEQGQTVINRFLSMLTWCCDQYAVSQGGWSGNPVPVAVPKRDMAFATAYDWYFNRNSPALAEAKRALALYRQGRNAEQNFLVSYAVLSYYKILEIKGSGNNIARNWIKDNYAKIKEIEWLAKDVAEFEKELGEKTPQQVLHDAYRTAVAHANNSNDGNYSDPDEFLELRRLHLGAEILRALARIYVKQEFAVSTSYLHDVCGDDEE